MGFREDFDVDVSRIVNDICTLECQVRSIDPRDSEEVIREIRDAAKRTTHMHVTSLRHWTGR